MKESIAMYTLWTFLEVLATAGASSGIAGVEKVLNGKLVFEKEPKSHTHYLIGQAPYIEVEGSIENIRVVKHSTGHLFHLKIDLVGSCITKKEVKQHFPDLYFAYMPTSPAVSAPFSYVTRVLDVPVLFRYLNNSATPDCLHSIIIDYQSRIDEYGMPPPPREEASVQESSEQ